MTSAIVSFSDNRSDVDRLLEIHQNLGGTGPGRRWNLEVLHKSAVVLTCSIWEAYIEDLIQEAVDHLAQHLTNPDKLPKHLRQRVAKEIKESLHELSPWELAGVGWQKVLKQRAVQLVAADTGRLNTPKSPQLKDLFANTLGVTDIIAFWKLPRQKPADVAKKLDTFITLRGAIAHRGKAASSITKKEADEFIALVSRLVVATDAAVREHVEAVTGKQMPFMLS